MGCFCSLIRLLVDILPYNLKGVLILFICLMSSDLQSKLMCENTMYKSLYDMNHYYYIDISYTK